ncbi:DUF3631 domain-containing protein [Paracoccus ravus]|uniref:DUF3631 domain-containing protein n=1 Tax=Paracoccus ravus TaxID=2447760 RepID=UPI00106DED2E|nr:DUF3631 domain-containing protein [Paracoccus ravus]
MNAMTDKLHPAEVSFDVSQPEARLAEIVKMSALDYEKAREKLAEELGVRVSYLDRAIARMRPKAEDEADDPFEDVEPAADPVDGAALLTELQATILRFCILPEHSAPLMAAWVLHAWAHDGFDISPVLGIVSPEKRCGKTTALSVVSALTPRAMHAVNISASVLFRVIEKFKPTVMVDEADTFLDADKNGDLRGMLNGGHNRLSAYVWRSHGDDHEPRRFKVWAPKVVAKIGNLPDTLEDRSLVVRLRRKRDGEKVERFRADRINDFLHLRQKAARWAKDNALTLANADPLVPEALHDRAQDNARCICAIADVVGGHWPVTIRTALVGMHQEVEADEPQSAGVLLLRDLADIFEAKRAERIGSTDLLNALCALEESPWSEWRGGRPISTRGIAKLLKPYGITPAQDRIGSFYRPTDFADAFNRYLSKGAENTATSTTSATHAATATEKHNKINANGTCGAYGTYSDGGGSKSHSGAWEREI